jgi:hypothetical protein
VRLDVRGGEECAALDNVAPGSGRAESGTSGSCADEGAQSETGATWPEVDRRSSGDRRHRPTPFWSAFLGLRRRRHGRRQDEHLGTYVDAFHRKDVALLVAIFVLNIFDALFTLIWMQRGGAEGNPVMAYFIELGDHAFLIQKCFVVGLWLVLLLVHKNFRIARLGLWAALTVYVVLIGYHFVLIASDVDPTTGRLPGEAAYSGELREQRWDSRLDAEAARAEARGDKTAGLKFLELVGGPATLRTDGQ